MNTIQNIIVVCGLMLGVVSCDLVGPLDDMRPHYQLDDDNVVSDAASAENMLRGVYACWRTQSITSMRTYMSLYAGSLNSLQSQIDMIPEGQDFLQGSVPDNNQALEPFYKDLYKVINMANLTIAQLEAGHAPDLSAKRQEEMIAECRFHRGLAHFYLLRHFGQFYDNASPYGIELRRKPFLSLETAPRSKVDDVYTFVLEDIGVAALQAPEEVSDGRHYYVSRLTAKALQARVLLCAGRYGEAEMLAAGVIRDAARYGYMLERDYAGIFTNGHASGEMLFGLYAHGQEESCYDNFEYTVFGDYTEHLAIREPVYDLTTGEGYDLRFAAVYGGEPGGDDNDDVDGEFIPDDGEFIPDDSEVVPVGASVPSGDISLDEYVPSVGEDEYEPDYPGYDPVGPQEVRRNKKYPFTDGVTNQQGNAYFIIRLAEVYYIHAEAAARTNKPDAARQSLETVLERAGYTRKDIERESSSDLLEFIRRHKWIELFSENNEEWFDMVRYYKEGNLSLADLGEIKSSLTDEKRLILPLPRTALAGNGLLVQNP